MTEKQISANSKKTLMFVGPGPGVENEKTTKGRKIEVDSKDCLPDAPKKKTKKMPQTLHNYFTSGAKPPPKKDSSSDDSVPTPVKKEGDKKSPSSGPLATDSKSSGTDSGPTPQQIKDNLKRLATAAKNKRRRQNRKQSKKKKDVPLSADETSSVDPAKDLRKQTRFDLATTQKQMTAARARTNNAAFRAEQKKRVEENRHIIEGVNTLIFKHRIF
jgi:hypothetical protein